MSYLDPSRWLAIDFPERLAQASLSQQPFTIAALRAILEQERAFWVIPCPLKNVPGASFVPAERANWALDALNEEWEGVDFLGAALQAQKAGAWAKAVRLYMRAMHSLHEAFHSWAFTYDQASDQTAFHVHGGMQQKLGELDLSPQSSSFSEVQMQAINQLLFRIHQQFSRVGSLILELSLRLTYCQSQAMQETETNGAPVDSTGDTVGTRGTDI